ncbi:MAG: hypothetical protein F4Y07_14340 [Gemmatimonadetes bacterium]|nr:hypothetical protein [Gemmatimonadota bacterium]MYE17652.1 hypothetical protein [Gemmatimonadota bacterium]
MSTETHQGKRAIRWLQAYAALMTIAIVALFFTDGTATDGVLRVRGLIIEDEAGRERILIGAPIPAAANRVRTDEARVRELWGPRFPDPERYMGWYRDYQHSTNGILILSEDGFDRLVLGDPVPDPNIGRRIGPNTGLLVNDPEGFERSGYGLIDVDGQYRVGLGIDSNRSQESLMLMLHDNDRVGIAVAEGEDMIFLGKGPNGYYRGPDEPFLGLAVMQGGEVVHNLNVVERN